MYLNLRRHIKPIWHIKNIFLKSEKFTVDKLRQVFVNHDNNCVNTQTYSTDYGSFFFNETFLRLNRKNENKNVYEMRRDRGGTVRKKLSREKKKTQKKQKKEKSADVYK
ncbi:hypothetical protein, conserved [Plasmodium gonderi]|uniref:Uncharacterized protein n=1 Tax=Plasmodium gonderi TaxID=77519 RepID=A0A1Y1JFN9_PLAGO|nr:hypothetical protein, conserved [Plasmodium gonderi]GAW79253.1 hypothetical protein, conserved [Plasmodium gonderi]